MERVRDCEPKAFFAYVVNVLVSLEIPSRRTRPHYDVDNLKEDVETLHRISRRT
jgi:hypothetical protein